MNTITIQNNKNTKDVIWLILIVSIAIIGGMASLGFGIDFDIYCNLQGGDMIGNYAFIKSIQESGLKGMYINYRTGAPDVCHLIDYPAADPIMGLIIWIISLFTVRTPAILYIYYLLTFVIDALALALLLRKMNVKRSIAAVIGLIFAFAPYHFIRGLYHVTLLNYMSFAISLYLSLCIIGYLEENKWKTFAAAIILGLSYGYYYAFGLIMMALAIVVRLFKTGKIKNSLTYIWIPLTTLFAILLSLCPQIVFNFFNGKNVLAGVRYPFEQEIYGLKIIQMFLPPDYSFLYELSSKLENSYEYYVSSAPLVNENVSASLGIVALGGFIGLCTACIYSFTARDNSIGVQWNLIDYLSLSTITLILTSIIGGFGELFNYLVTPQIRCYNRSSIYIAGLSLVFVAMVLNRIHFRRQRVLTLCCSLLLVFSMYDTVLVENANWQGEMEKTQNCYESFFSEAERILDRGAMVYQLPYLDYPEENATYDYKHFVGFLFTKNLRWSYGGIKGRDMEAKELLADEGESHQFIKNIKNAGFEAVYIDRAGYEDNGERVISFYDTLGISPIVSSDGTLYIYDIRGLDG